MDWSKTTGCVAIDSRFLKYKLFFNCSEKTDWYIALIYSFAFPFDRLSFKKLYPPLKVGGDVESIKFSDYGNMFALVFQSDILIYENCVLLYKESFNDTVSDFKWISNNHVYAFTGNLPCKSGYDDFACGPRMGPGLKGSNGFVFMLRSGQVSIKPIIIAFCQIYPWSKSMDVYELFSI
jgi:hypothetical protein